MARIAPESFLQEMASIFRVPLKMKQLDVSDGLDQESGSPNQGGWPEQGAWMRVDPKDGQGDDVEDRALEKEDVEVDSERALIFPSFFHLPVAEIFLFAAVFEVDVDEEPEAPKSDQKIDEEAARGGGIEKIADPGGNNKPEAPGLIGEIASFLYKGISSPNSHVEEQNESGEQKG